MKVFLPVKRSLLAATALILLPITSRAITPLYNVQVLGLVQQNYPTSYFVPTAINENGVVAGNAAVKVPDNTGRPLRAVLWQNTPGANYTILGTLSEQQPKDSFVLAINLSGISVGGSYRSNQYGVETYPVLFNAQGIVDLGIKSGFYGFASGINDAGQVVGKIGFPGHPSAAQEAFIYQNGVMTMLGYPIPTVGESSAAAINNNGLIVGYARFSATSYKVTRRLLFQWKVDRPGHD